MLQYSQLNPLVPDFLLQREKWEVLLIRTSGKCIETKAFIYNFFSNILSHFWDARQECVNGRPLSCNFDRVISFGAI